MEVICPQEAVLAIVKGAVMFGNNPRLIQERISPRTYGICVNEPFDSTQHPTHLKCNFFPTQLFAGEQHF
jgi:hypothetical protein